MTTLKTDCMHLRPHPYLIFDAHVVDCSRVKDLKTDCMHLRPPPYLMFVAHVIDREIYVWRVTVLL